MKIALSFLGCHRRGGVERIVYECARFLSMRGHDVNVLASDWETDPTTDITYTDIPAIRRPLALAAVSYFRKCSAQLKHLDYDVLGTHGCVCPTGGVHWVQSVQKAWLGQCQINRTRFGKRWLLQKCNPLHPILLNLEQRHFAQRQYSKVIVTTRRVQEDLNRFYSVPADDVVIIPNGFSPLEFNPNRRKENRESMRLKHHLREDDVALLFAANELDRKGYGTLLKALKILDRKDVKLMVVGRPDVAEVRQRAADAGVADMVLACGHSANIAEFHAAADLFVLPTQYEAFCLAILEALGSGLPVITSNVPGAADAILPNVNGLIISDPNNAEELAAALATLLDQDVRRQISERAPGTVEKYQWPSVLESYERVLLEHSRMSAATPSSVSSQLGVVNCGH